MQRWQVRVAPTLGGGFAGEATEAWGCLPYSDPMVPTVFFGMYGMQDLQALYNHDGKAAVLWAGSDIRNLNNGYWLDSVGKSRMINIPPFLKDVPHFCENIVEQIALEAAGLEDVEVIPSFLGNIDDYPAQEINTNKRRYYSSVSGDDFELYGWDEIERWADRYPDIEFHLFGNRQRLITRFPNLFYYGRVSQEEMDEKTRTMTGALRLTRFDGFSEILAKSILWGQAPVSPYIHYPGVARSLEDKTKPNREGWVKIINKYPWYAKDN